MSPDSKPGLRLAGDPVRGQISRAMVELAGERGLGPTTVAMICERAAVGRAAFERSFGGKEDCFVQVHEEIARELCGSVRTAYEGRRAWHDRIWAAALAAMRFLRADALRARFLLVAVDGAGTRAQACRDRFLGGLAELIDAGRAELDESDLATHSTAEMVTGAIYGSLTTQIRAGAIERGEDFLPELVYLATMPYLGVRAAEDDLTVQPLR